MKDDILLTIDQVESGLACRCVCPCCGAQLLAKKGSAKLHHFSHYRSPECRGGLETPLHRLCKEIILQKKAFTVPPYVSARGRQMSGAVTVRVDTIYLEKRLDNIIPDIVLECEGKQLLIEIEVSHPVDEKKLRKIKKAGHAVVVFDARKMVRERFACGDYFLQDEAFQQELVYGTAFKRWLHNPRLKTIEQQQAKEKAQRKQEAFLQRNYITAPKGVVKEFRSFKKKNGGELFYVDACPIAARTWKSGPGAGKAYASMDDCKTCRFCQKLEWRPFPRVDFVKHLFPHKVDCTGNLTTSFHREAFIVTGKGPRDYFQQAGRFLVKTHTGEERFFYRFHAAYNHYLTCGAAAVFDARTGELIEQKIPK